MNMKKIFYILSLGACIALASCEKEPLDNWFTETFDYAGRYTTAIECIQYPSNTAYEGAIFADIHDAVAESIEFQLYNSAANVADEIWIKDVKEFFPFRAKFKITGTPASFKSVADGENQHTELIEIPGNAPTAAGQTEDVWWGYRYVSLDDAKIIKGGATTIGGNTTDSISFTVTLKSGTVTVKSVQPDPNANEYKWEVQRDTYQPDPSADEIWHMFGYRYSGFPEDR
jgi:hypothetical protein